MQQLIDQLTSTYEMSAEDATQIIEMVQNYKAPDTETATDDTENEATANIQPAPVAATITKPVAPATTDVKEESMFEKATHFVEDHLPSGMKEKAEEMLGGLGSKVKGLFGGN